MAVVCCFAERIGTPFGIHFHELKIYVEQLGFSPKFGRVINFYLMNKTQWFYPETTPFHHSMIIKFFFVGLWAFLIKFGWKQVENSAAGRGEMSER